MEVVASAEDEPSDPELESPSEESSSAVASGEEEESGEEESHVAASEVGESNEEPSEDDVGSRDAQLARSLYIRRAVELKLYGYTGGCGGCWAAEHDLPAATHNPDCRARIIRAMRAAGDVERLDQAERRASMASAKAKAAARAAPGGSAS